MRDPREVRRLLGQEAERLHAVRRVLEEEGLQEAPEEASFGELSRSDQHQADVASDVFEREKEFSLFRRVHTDLRDVDDALGRLASGTYGRCETCGTSIPDERLAAMPATRYCIDHQSYWEAVRMTLTPPPGPAPAVTSPSIDQLTELAALLNLDLLSTEDEITEPLSVGPEESAIHIEGAGERSRPTASEIEDVEAHHSEEEDLERATGGDEDREWRHDLDDAIDEEERLGSG